MVFIQGPRYIVSMPWENKVEKEMVPREPTFLLQKLIINFRVVHYYSRVFSGVLSFLSLVITLWDTGG